MSKKMAFLNTDKLWYIATYTDNGDFSSLSEKGYETLELANAGAGFPEGTPAGELVQDGEVVEVAKAPEVAPEPTAETVSVGNQPATEEAPTATVEAEAPVVTPEVAPEAPAVEVAPETAPVEANTDAGAGDTTPTSGEVNTAETLPTEPVAEAPVVTEEAPVDTVKDETAPVNA
jgi:hypothetical protein